MSDLLGEAEELLLILNHAEESVFLETEMNCRCEAWNANEALRKDNKTNGINVQP